MTRIRICLLEDEVMELSYLRHKLDGARAYEYEGVHLTAV